MATRVLLIVSVGRVAEDAEEEMARQAAVDDDEAGKGVLPLVAAPWPPSWAYVADNDDEDFEEELVPQTPSATKFFNDDVVVDKVDGREVECVAGTSDAWQEVMPRRGPAVPPEFFIPASCLLSCPCLVQG
jgi:hypothetical protein